MSPEIKGKLKTLKTKLRIPKGVIPSPEKVSEPQARLEAIIDRFERGWAKKGLSSPRSERNWGDCNIAPDILTYVVRDQSKRESFTADSQQYQVQALHETAGGPIAQAFRHAFNVITVEDKTFLVDLTFAQFLGNEGYLYQVNDRYSSKAENDNPLAQSLITDGYVPLTDANLQEYLRITSLADNQSYIRNMTIDRLASAPTLPMELMKGDGVTPEFGQQI